MFLAYKVHQWCGPRLCYKHGIRLVLTWIFNVYCIANKVGTPMCLPSSFNPTRAPVMGCEHCRHLSLPCFCLLDIGNPDYFQVLAFSIESVLVGSGICWVPRSGSKIYITQHSWFLLHSIPLNYHCPDPTQLPLPWSPSIILEFHYLDSTWLSLIL